MKKNLFSFLLLFTFILILCFPKQALEGSSNGLLLWFYTVLPTLLPFIILTNLILRLDAVHYLTSLFSPILKRLFPISSYGCYAMLIGFLCGYPMGAKITADLVRQKNISLKEGQYLLGICNNVSPMFFISYVITQSFNLPNHKIPLLFIIYTPPIVYALINRASLPKITANSSLPKKDTKVHLNFQILDESIMNGFETITRLGGYIILFAIIAKMVTAIPHTVTILDSIFIGIIEITNGIHEISISILPISYKLILATTLISFGGLSSIAQTMSMIQGTSLSIKKYISSKLVIALFTFMLASLYCLVIRNVI